MGSILDGGGKKDIATSKNQSGVQSMKKVDVLASILADYVDKCPSGVRPLLEVRTLEVLEALRPLRLNPLQLQGALMGALLKTIRENVGELNIGEVL